jgi:hypothetical protein
VDLHEEIESSLTLPITCSERVTLSGCSATSPVECVRSQIDQVF